MGDHGGNFDHDSTAQTRRQYRRKHIFIVNGAADFLEMLRQLFQDERFNVTTTNYVPETFDVIRVLEPDLAILDLTIRDQHGEDLVERLDADRFTWDLPLILLSTDHRVLDRAREAQPERSGPRHYMVKPLDLDRLVAVVDGIVGSAEQEPAGSVGMAGQVPPQR